MWLNIVYYCNLGGKLGGKFFMLLYSKPRSLSYYKVNRSDR